MRCYMLSFLGILFSSWIGATDVALVNAPTMDSNLARKESINAPFHNRIFQLDNYSKTISNFQMKCDVLLQTIEKGKETKLELDSSFTCYQEGWIKVGISYGPLPVIDFGLSPKDCCLKLSRDNVSYVGTIDEAKNGKKMARILSIDISGTKMLFPEVWDEKANCRFLRSENGNQVVYICSRNDKDIAPIKKVCFVFEDDKLVISKIIRYENKQVDSMISYSEYKDIQADGQQLFVPTKIQVNIDPNTSFLFSLKELKVNRKNNPSETRVFPAEGQDVLPFSHMR